MKTTAQPTFTPAAAAAAAVPPPTPPPPTPHYTPPHFTHHDGRREDEADVGCAGALPEPRGLGPADAAGESHVRRHCE